MSSLTSEIFPQGIQELLAQSVDLARASAAFTSQTRAISASLREQVDVTRSFLTSTREHSQERFAQLTAIVEQAYVVHPALVAIAGPTPAHTNRLTRQPSQAQMLPDLPPLPQARNSGGSRTR